MSWVLKRIAFFITLSVSALIILTDIGMAQDGVKILFVKGSPKIMKSRTNEWRDCKAGMDIDNGDRVKTSGGEGVEISFLKDNSNVIKISENSDTLIKKREAPYSIELLNGEVMSLIKRLPKRSTFEVRTPAGLSGARGTGWRSRTTGENSTFDSFERSIYTRGIDTSGQEMKGELIVGSGWTTTLNRFERPGKIERLSREDFKEWNRWKDELAEHISGGGSGGGSVGALDKIASKEKKLERMEKEGLLERRDIDKIRERLESSSSSSDSGSGGDDIGGRQY